MRIPDVKVKSGQPEKEAAEVLVLAQHEDESPPADLKSLDQAVAGSLG